MSRYVSSDWHGQINLAKQIFNYLKPEDELYFLGDAADRGPAGYEIIKMLLSDSRVTYIKGNHEDILSICVPEFLQGEMYNYSWWYVNGGIPTWNSIEDEQLPDEVILSFVNKINKLPERIDLINSKGQNLILTHAGTDPRTDERYWELRGIKKPYLWNRQHSFKFWSGNNNTYIIHGHTPVQHLPGLYNKDDKNFIPEVTFYCENHKIDIDMGSFYTGRAALMNIDTFEVKYFEAEPQGEWA